MRATIIKSAFAVLIGGAVACGPVALAAKPEADQVSLQDRDHWAFRKVLRPQVPTPRHASLAATPLDAFMLARLEEQKLVFSPPADKHTLLRRAFLDLLGLPPSRDQVAEFAADQSPNAFARWVDRLLASPRFGERWGRHWLDVVGYADTVGFDTDANNLILSGGKWKYRDYVIQAFNADKPYDRFLTEQIAGDELSNWRRAPRFTPEIRNDLIATGYLRTARDQTHEPESNIQLCYYDVLHDTVEMLGNSLFALTVNCARCHSHKFDPIPQRDYYRLMALLTPAYNPDHWKPVFAWKPGIKDRGLADASSSECAEIERLNSAVDRDVAEMQSRMSRPGCAVELKAKLKRRIADRARQRREVGQIQAIYDVGPPPATHLLLRGQYQAPGPEVQPGFLTVLCDSEQEAVLHEQKAAGPDSHRRTAFAQWLTRNDSRAAGLVARVMVNRIWQHLFGEGLCRTPENFGVQGEIPTHPELLEWLSAEFMNESGWRVKPLIRQMMLSAAYRQSSQVSGNPSAGLAAKADPENHLLWRMRPKRLEAEVIRDCILAVSGRLDSTMGGPPVLLVARPDGLVTVDESKLQRPSDAFKRSVYLLSRRAYNLSLLTVFDRPIFAVNCPKRDVSVVPLQSLTMLNDAFLAEQAERFAARVAGTGRKGATAAMEAHSSIPRRDASEIVRSAFDVALARDPSDKELRRCNDYLAAQRRLYETAGDSDAVAGRKAAVQLCHTLLNTSEFLYSE